MQKIKVTKGSVIETLLIPLYGKAKAGELFPDLFKDRESAKILEKIDYEMKPLPNIKEKIGAIMAGNRQYDLAAVCKDYLNTHPDASLINLGCGLDATFALVDNGKAKGFNIDFAEVITIREQLITSLANEKNISSDLNNLSWFDKIEFDREKGAVFFASGVFYYFKKEQVKTLIKAMADKFSGAKIVFDATNKRGLKKMTKTWLKASEMEDAAVYFYLEDESEIYTWSDKIKSVTKKGYNIGYRELDKRFGLIANLLFKYADNSNLNQIIEIEFK